MQKVNTKQIRDAFNTYQNSNMTDIYDLYNRPSRYKHDIWYDWKRKLTNAKILGGNCNQFSIGGFITIEDVEYFAYITKSYDRIIPVNELI